MSKWKRHIPAVLMFLHLLIPICRLNVFLPGYSFQALCPAVTACALAALYIWLTILYCRRSQAPGTPQKVFAVAAIPSALLNLLISAAGELPFILSAAAGCVCSVIILARVLEKTWLRVALTSLAALVTAFTLFFTLLMAPFASIGATETIQTVASPDNTQYAEIISVNEGALGGSTMVKVKNDRRIFCLLGFIYREQDIYIGEYGEHENMVVSWQDEHTILINGQPYNIK